MRRTPEELDKMIAEYESTIEGMHRRIIKDMVSMRALNLRLRKLITERERAKKGK